MSYLGELRRNVRSLAAASLGAGTSLPLFAYTNSVFSPHLVRQFGWSRSQFALVGLTMLATLVVLPFIGRFTDRFGVRRVALVGTLLTPLCFVAYAAMQGSFLYFLAVSSAVLVVGSMTSTLVYTRLIAENFERARGLALTVVNCAPAVLAMPLVPLLNRAIEMAGWRVAYLGLGGLALVCGLAALALIPQGRPAPGTRAASSAPDDQETSGQETSGQETSGQDTSGQDASGRDASGQDADDRPGPAAANVAISAPGAGDDDAVLRSAREDYGLILRSRVFWIIMAGMVLCLLQTPLHASQMNLMLMDNGLTAQGAANVVAIYAFGTIVGRIGCGLALDRFSTPLVTALSMGIPAIGYFLLATPMNGTTLISGAMFLVGLSVGAESDLVSFVVVRYFKLRIYSTTLGLLFAATFLAAAGGAATISLILKWTDSFTPFLYLVSGTIAVGALLFLLLPASRDVERIG